MKPKAGFFERSMKLRKFQQDLQRKKKHTKITTEFERIDIATTLQRVKGNHNL